MDLSSYERLSAGQPALGHVVSLRTASEQHDGLNHEPRLNLAPTGDA